MRQSRLYPKTKREAPKEAVSVNHKLLVRAGFIDQLMTGSWTLLPMGLKVINNINQIIREELNKTGAQEVLMPVMNPKSVWSETGRWEKASEIMYQFKDSRGKEYGLSFTHEEIVMDLIRKSTLTYKDLPIAIYHFSIKFRNEPRARSGILRGREFMMKDLYSLHADEDDMNRYYEEISRSYMKIFKRIGFDVKATEAAGGVFTQGHTREFQVPAKGGEDTIYVCGKCEFSFNKELLDEYGSDKCPKCGEKGMKQIKSVEVGNIFPLGTWYSERMKVYYTSDSGEKKPVYFASYGIGPTRTMGAWVESSSDDKGIVWSKSISPFQAHLLSVGTDADRVYESLLQEDIDILYDDRSVSAGEKFADSDLIGIPVRLVVSSQTKDKIEWKERNSDEKSLMGINEVIKKLKSGE